MIRVRNSEFSADKSSWTAQVQDLSVLKGYTRRSASDSEQRCIEGEPLRLNAAENLRDAGSGVVRWAQKPVVQGDVLDKIPPFARDNVLSLLEKDEDGNNRWVYIEKDIPYNSCGSKSPETRPGDILAKGSWKYEDGVLTLTLDPGYKLNYLLPYQADESGNITLTDIKKVSGSESGDKLDLMGMLKGLLTPKAYEKGAIPPLYCRARKAVDLSRRENLREEGQGGVRLREVEFDDPEVDIRFIRNASWQLSLNPPESARPSAGLTNTAPQLCAGQFARAGARRKMGVQ